MTLGGKKRRTFDRVECATRCDVTPCCARPALRPRGTGCARNFGEGRLDLPGIQQTARARDAIDRQRRRCSRLAHDHQIAEFAFQALPPAGAGHPGHELGRNPVEPDAQILQRHRFARGLHDGGDRRRLHATEAFAQLILEKPQIEPAVERTASGEGDHQPLAPRRIARGAPCIAIDRSRPCFQIADLVGQFGFAAGQGGKVDRRDRGVGLARHDYDRRLSVAANR
ncbi:hypothetical protein [Sphingomonas sp. Ant H11]|uniref:hypothetical protein n=1 Tax=Sphingomonas sp. Ant H11 TaxID=1564113 RepID=UPI001E457789|nr:hypothetical protein [Sphingomonas sp. Ant H11]